MVALRSVFGLMFLKLFCLSRAAQIPLNDEKHAPATSFHDDFAAWTDMSPEHSRKVLELHKNLCEIPSVSEHEADVAQWLVGYLGRAGWVVETQKVAPKRWNVVAFSSEDDRDEFLGVEEGEERGTLITSHIDTVPPHIPFRVNATHHIGRGTIDAKGSVAAQIIAANRLLHLRQVQTKDDGWNVPPLALLYVVGEERDAIGMRAANDLHLQPKVVIFGEPTESHLARAHKGGVAFYLNVTGKAAHSGYPWLGVSAIEALISILQEIKLLEGTLPSDEVFGSSTINIGQFHGGEAPNVVSEHARAVVQIRIAASSIDEIQDEVFAALKRGVATFGSKVTISSTWSEGYGPVKLDAGVKGFEDEITVNYGTDVPHLKKTVKGQRRYLWGPGTILLAHGEQEAILKAELINAVKRYAQLVLQTAET